jgi:L-rhamnose mutarotase
MRLIDYTYLQFGISLIPVNDVTGAVGLGQIAKINDYIDKVQPEVLKTIMGKDLYDEFMAGLAATPIATKWANMKAQIVNTTAKTSFLTYFVKFESQKYTQTIPTESGDKKVTGANMQTVIDMVKNVSIYNQGVERANIFSEWLYENRATYDISTVNLHEKMNQFGI